MRVTGMGPTGATQRGQKKGKTEAAGGFSSLLSSASAEETSSTNGPVAASPLEGVDALLALQEIGDREGGHNTRAAKRGNDILEQLEGIRDGLLEGRFSRSRIVRLAELVAQQKEQFVDPRLQEILDEIEVRAAVELVKLEQVQQI